MNQNPVTCVWVFSAEEYKTTQVLARRIHTPWGYLAYFACVPILGIVGMFTGKEKNNFHDPGYWIPIIILLLLILYVVSQQLPIRAFCGTWRFRRSDLNNARLTQTISGEGYHSEEADVRVAVKWPGLVRGLETTEGFALFRAGKKKTFLWIPKHGFSKAEDIDQCRNFIREHLQDFCILNP